MNDPDTMIDRDSSRLAVSCGYELSSSEKKLVSSVNEININGAKDFKGNGNEVSPPAAEYFGIALVFAALWWWLKGVSKCGRMDCLLKESPGLKSEEILASGDLFTRGIQKLRVLVWAVCELEGKVDAKALANAELAKELDLLRSEKIELLKNVSKIESEVQELKKRRNEDARANEKVARIFATQEQGWKNERKKLKQDLQNHRFELQKSWKEMSVLQQRMESADVLGGNDCNECSAKETLVMELKERLREQEFLMMATVEESKAEQQEKNELARKLETAEGVISELRDKLGKEVVERALESQKHQAILSEFKLKQRQAEMDFSRVFEEFESSKRKIGILSEENKCMNELIERLSIELTKLQKDSHEKEKVISAMLSKAHADREEKQELKRELAISKKKNMHAETEEESWKQLSVEKVHSRHDKEVHRLRSSFESTMESSMDMVPEMWRLQDVQVQTTHSLYGEPVKALQNKVKLYQDRVAELEKCILLYMANGKCVLRNNEQKTMEASGSKQIVDLDGPIDADIATKQRQLSVAKDLLVHYMDANHSREWEIENWKNLYFAMIANAEMLRKEKWNTVSVGRRPQLQDLLKVEKARYTSQLEQRHLQAVDAFERQMMAKDERMEAFRWQLLNLEKEAHERLEKIAVLNKDLKLLKEEKLKMESILNQKELEVISYKKLFGQHVPVPVGIIEENKGNKDEGEIGILQREIQTSKKLFKEKELQHEATMMKVLGEAEAELQEKDITLGVVEMKLAQTQLNFGREKKTKDKTTSQAFKQRASLENFLRNHLSEKTHLNVTDALGAVCLEVERLSKKVVEAQEQILQMEQQHEDHMKDLVSQTANISSSGQQLKCLKDLSPITEENNERKLVLEQKLPGMMQGVEGYICQEELSVDKFVSNVEPDCSPIEVLLSGSPNKMMSEFSSLDGDSMSPSFCQNLPLMDKEGNQAAHKVLQMDDKLNLNGKFDFKNFLHKGSKDSSLSNNLQEQALIFDDLNLTGGHQVCRSYHFAERILNNIP